jgi:hypothetical protein
MGTGFSTPNGTIGLGSTGNLGDSNGTFAVGLGLSNTGFISNTTITGGYFNNQDVGITLQTKYYNVFFSETLLCDYPAGVNLKTGYKIQQAGNTDLSDWFALFDSLYVTLPFYSQTSYTSSSDGGGNYKISTN